MAVALAVLTHCAPPPRPEDGVRAAYRAARQRFRHGDYTGLAAMYSTPSLEYLKRHLDFLRTLSDEELRRHAEPMGLSTVEFKNLTVPRWLEFTFTVLTSREGRKPDFDREIVDVTVEGGIGRIHFDEGGDMRFVQEHGAWKVHIFESAGTPPVAP